AAVRPVISFSPNWNPIFSGESVTLTCNVTPTAQGNLEYSWYRGEHWISGDQDRVIQAASWSDRGNYQCQAGANERSEYFRLDVSYDYPLILQVPPTVYEGDLYEGDSLSLRCHSRSGFFTRNQVFYRDNKIIESPVSESVLHIGPVNITASGTYKCQKEICYNCYRTLSLYTSYRTISVS
ncbi:hypothetical protein XELAEV_18042839mg, partial [Xenopus laevis]